jgi:hypothetical protein
MHLNSNKHDAQVFSVLLLLLLLFLLNNKYKYFFILYYLKYFFLYAYVLSNYEQNMILFMYHQTNYDRNCHVKYKDDKLEDHYNHLQLIYHDVYPNLNFKMKNIKKNI